MQGKREDSYNEDQKEKTYTERKGVREMPLLAQPHKRPDRLAHAENLPVSAVLCTSIKHSLSPFSWMDASKRRIPGAELCGENIRNTSVNGAG